VSSPSCLGSAVSEFLTVLPKTVALFKTGHVKSIEDMESEMENGGNEYGSLKTKTEVHYT
jgi:hypothetical protein